MSELYLYLTKTHGFTPGEICEMNPYQQYVYYRGEKVIQLSSLDEYNAYKQSRGA